MRLYIIILFLSSINFAFGQNKFEKESRINTDEVPEKGIQFISKVNTSSKVKWYFEQGLTDNSYEAKTKISNRKYSIEFDTLFNIQDVEIEISQSEMPKPTISKIEMVLDSIYKKHSISKIQIQYQGDKKTLIEVINNNSIENLSPKVKTQYEIIVKCKSTGRPKLYEFTFDAEGKLISKKEIIFNTSDHLEY